MFVKKIRINIFSTKIPYKIIIYSLDGEVFVNQLAMQNATTFCVCCKSFRIAIKVEYANQIQTKYFILTNARCQFLNTYFRFQDLLLRQNFILLDKNYNLPINSAKLSFTEKSSNNFSGFLFLSCIVCIFFAILIKIPHFILFLFLFCCIMWLQFKKIFLRQK